MIPVYYAIGDIHGCDDLLERLHGQIVAHHTMRYADRPGTLIHLGDYVDRGLHSREVIDRVMKGVADFENICLLGNHEDMMLECLETDDSGLWRIWLENGGEETLASFDLSFRFNRYDPHGLREALEPRRIQWLESLPLYHQVPGYLFVHAGIVPGRLFDQQKRKDLLWIRERFLDSKEDHGAIIVHGHTPTDEPELKANRIGIDTGAYFSGRLTAVVLSGPDARRESEFLVAEY